MDMNIRDVAKLARLELSDEEAEALSGQLAGILNHVQTLEKLNTDGVEPTTHVVSVTCPMRADETAPCLSSDDALSNAPEHDGGSFVVPRVV